MLAAKTLFLLGAAMAATAFIIPKGAADGFYLAYYDSAGNEVHELVTDMSPFAANLTERSISSSAKIGKPGQTCGGTGISGNSAFYSIQNPSVAFMCNKDGYSATVSGGNVPTGFEHVTRACGLYVAGTWRIDGLLAMDYGYMNWNDGLDFCRNAEGSGSHSC